MNAGDSFAVADIGFNLDAFGELDASLRASAIANASTGGSSVGAGFNGCLDVWTGFSIVGGCNGEFFDVFPVAVSTTLYSGSWDIFKVCTYSLYNGLA